MCGFWGFADAMEAGTSEFINLDQTEMKQEAEDYEEMQYDIFNSDSDNDLVKSEFDSIFSDSDSEELDGPETADEVLTNIEWKKDKCEFRDIKFSGRPFLNCKLENGNPIDYFNLLINEHFYEMVIRETNKNAVSVLLSEEVTTSSRITEWKDLTLEELEKFFGLLIHMKTIALPRIEDYWKTDPLLSIPIFKNTMSRNRFMLILRCLHFTGSSPDEDEASEDRIEKIQPIVDHFNNTMAAVYSPGRELCIKESVVPWRGRFESGTIKTRGFKTGVMMHMLLEPSGIILKFLLSMLCEKGNSKGVVLELMKDRVKRGHSLFVAEYYNGINLVETLLRENTYCTGMLKSVKKKIPSSILADKVKKGETDCCYANGIIIGKWRDNKEVVFISSEFDNYILTTTSRKGRVVSKPKPIIEFSKCMNSLEKQTNWGTYYPNSRKSMKCYRKLGIHILHLMLNNAFYLYRQFSGKKTTTYDFRLSIVRSLVGVEVNIKPILISSMHTLAKCGKNDNNRSLRKRCRMCSKEGMRRDTIYYCSKCPEKPGLCLTPCFELFHKEQK